jgi:competence protein ComEC
MTADGASTPCGAALAALPGVPVRRLAAGDRAAVGRWRLRVVHPPGPPGGPGEGGAGDGTRNDRSLVVVAEALGRRCLLTGDAEARAERRVAGLLADGGAAGPYDVLKVAHHGSKTSTTPALLAAARPRLALVSAGPGNPYGHPAGEVVRRLVRAGARVLRTDRDGAVHLAWDDAGPLRIELPGSPR